MSYNGWPNYETWNVTLWLGNDAGLYNQARTFARHTRPITAKDARLFVMNLMPEGTPDFAASRYSKVRWHSVALWLVGCR